ncbi:MAG: M48 family metallopeptidase [Betaproteobacteria bacterium]|nr:MAG: M48 family metallopeptidase [Betaproteobacteria bacterium]
MTVRAAWWCAVWVIQVVAAAGCARMPTSVLGIPIPAPEAKLPPEAVDLLGAFAFQWTLQTSEIATNPPQEERIKRVVDRLTGAAKQNKKYAEVAGKFQWEVKLLKDDQKPNAFAFPNGKIGVYTGLFRVTKDEEPKLAAVLAHEIVHALARHAAERMDKELQRTLALAAMKGELKEAGISSDKRRGILIAMGLSSQVSDILPFSRMHESEADHEGLLLMAQAGYDPQEAIAFWERMEKFTGGSGGRIPELLSTHPSYETRSRQLKEWNPEAQRYYKQYRSSRPGKG